MQFIDFKNYVVTTAKKAGASCGEYRKALQADNWNDFLQVVKDNANWCYQNNVITVDVLEKYVPDEILLENGIYVKKSNIEQREGFALYYSSTSEHYGSSTSKHYGSSTSKHYDSSTSKHYDSSTSKHYGSSTSKHYDSSTSKHYGSSTSEHYGSSTSEHYDSSTYGNVWTLHDTSIVHEKAIVRERNTGKIYFKKDAFTIVEL